MGLFSGIGEHFQSVILPVTSHVGDSGNVCGLRDYWLNHRVWDVRTDVMAVF